MSLVSQLPAFSGGIVVAGIAALLLVSCGGPEATHRTVDSPVAGKVICVDPGHGGTAESDSFRVGPSGEREEWIDLRVALMLQQLLEERGARVIMTRTEDVPVELADRAQMAKDQHADVFVSIHHNATADPAVNFPIVYFHGTASENVASVVLGRIVARRIRDALFDEATPACVISDHAIFPTAGANVLRNSYGIPGVIGEASFFSNAAEETRLQDTSYNQREAEAYLASLEEFFAGDVPPIAAQDMQRKLPPFEVLQEGERMEEEAMAWQELYQQGMEQLTRQDRASLEAALDLFTRSARAFPDSYLAGECHRRRADVLAALGDDQAAAVARRRAQEHYVAVD